MSPETHPVNYNDLIGRPFDEKTNNCYDVLREVFKRHGIDIPETNIAVCACRQSSNLEIKNHIWMSWKEIEQSQVKNHVPCGILIRSTDPNFANHIAAYIGKGKMIHTTLNRAVAVDRIADYQHKILGFYIYVGHPNNH